MRKSRAAVVTLILTLAITLSAIHPLAFSTASARDTRGLGDLTAPARAPSHASLIQSAGPVPAPSSTAVGPISGGEKASDSVAEYAIRYVSPNSTLLPASAREAIRDALSAWPYSPPENYTFYLIGLRWETTWALGTLTSADLDRPLGNGEDTRLGDGMLISLLLVETLGKWEAAIDADARVQALLRRVPESELSVSAREAIFPTGELSPSQSYNSYKFPWPSGQAWRVTQGWHDSYTWGGLFPPNNSIDFDILGASNSDILAAAPGVVHYMCEGYSDQYLVVITTDGTSERLGYLHLDGATVRARGIEVGVSVGQGTVLGQMRYADGGTVSDSCGTSYGTHIHLYFPERPFTIDSVTFTDEDVHLGEDLYSSQGGGTDTTPPTASWSSPSNGQTISSDTVHLRADASDDSSGVNRVAFSAKWNGSWHSVATDTSAPYEYYWNWCDSSVPNGDVELGLEAWDNAGNHFVYSEHYANYHINKSYDCPGNEYPVRLYENAGSGGRGLLFPQVDYGWWNLTDYDFNDIASSVEIDAGWSTRLWLDTGLQPSNCYKCLNSGDSDFGGDYFDGGCGVSLNDQASSIEVFHNTSCTTPCNPPSAPNLSSPSSGAELYPEDDLVFEWTGNASEYQVHWWGGPGGDHYSDWMSGTSWNVGTQWESPNAYYWEARGRNGVGCEGPWSLPSEFRIGPKAPTNLAASAVSSSQINLSWQDNSTTESDYHIERSSDGSNWGWIGTVGSGTTYQNTGLTPQTTYYYRVRAYRVSDDTYSKYSNVAGATTPSPPVEVVQALSLSPAAPLAGEEVSATLIIRNTTGGEITLRRLVVVVHGPDCATWECPNLADFPVEEYVTLQPGQEYTYLRARVFALSGSYLFEPFYEDMDGSWHSLGDRGSFTVSPGLEVVQALTLSPPEPLAEQMVTAQYTVQNQGPREISIVGMGVVVRGPDCVDLECPYHADFDPVGTIVLQPGQEYTYSRSRSFDTAGSGFFAEPRFMDANSWWHLFSGGNRVDFSVSPGVVLQHLVTLTPSDPLAGEEVVASFAIRNDSAQTVMLRRLVLGVRGPGCATWDCPYTADFFAEEYVTLTAGEEYVYNRSRVFPHPGEYLGDPLYEDMDGYWHSLGNRGSFTVSPGLSIVQPLTLSPSEPTTGQMVTAEYTIRNQGARAISLEGLGVAARGPDCSDLACPNNVDFPLEAGITLQPSQDYSYSQDRSFDVAGDGYFAEPTFMDANGWWYPFDAGNRVTFSVASAPEVGWLDAHVDLQGRADDSGATFTAWSGGEQEAGSCTSDSAGTCSIELPAGTYSVTAAMASYLDSVWESVSINAGESATLPTVTLLGGDANDDCVINIQDLAFMGYRFNACVGDPLYDLGGDINADGCINILDLTMAGSNFNRACPVPW